MNCISHITHGLWTLPDNNRERFNDIDYWVELAQLLESGGFDAVFLADVVGVYDVFRGSAATSIREGLQIPSNDPASVVPAMAAVTRRRRGRPGRGGESDLQGHLYRRAQALPRPLRRRDRAERPRRADAGRRRTAPSPGRRAHAAAGAHRDRRDGPRARTVRHRPAARRPRGVRRLVGGHRPARRGLPADPDGGTVTTLRTDQDLDRDRLREVFGIFPSGVVAVAASVDGVPVGLAA